MPLRREFPSSWRLARGAARAALAAALTAAMPMRAAAPVGAAIANEPPTTMGRVSGLPVPRFVSTKSGRANVRRGPSFEYPIEWIYVRAGMPVEIIAEFDVWRRVRDRDGEVGWIHRTQLDARRMALVISESAGERIALRADAAAGARAVAFAEPGLIARLQECAGGWCRISAQRVNGWVETHNLWGVYAREKFE